MNHCIFLSFLKKNSQFSLKKSPFFKRLFLFKWAGAKSQRGIGIIEILVVVAIIGIALVSLTGLANFTLKVNAQLKKNLIATNLASEAVEAVRAIKDGSWADLASYSTGIAYHPVQSAGEWQLASGSETIGDFSRQIILDQVYRDGSDDITASGGVLDPNTLKITATVSWTEKGAAQQVSLIDYLADWKP